MDKTQIVEQIRTVLCSNFEKAPMTTTAVTLVIMAVLGWL